jgi:hypothetical protein
MIDSRLCRYPFFFMLLATFFRIPLAYLGIVLISEIGQSNDE